MRQYTVYRYYLPETKMSYVGCTCQTKEQRAGVNGKNYSSIFGKAIKKYGYENFEYSVLEQGLTKEQAEDREKYWIQELNSVFPNGYNVLEGGTEGLGGSWCHYDNKDLITPDNSCIFNSTEFKRMENSRNYKIYSQYNNGKSAEDIAKDENISRARVYQILGQMKLKLSEIKEDNTTIDNNEIITLRAEITALKEEKERLYKIIDKLMGQ